MEDPHFQRGFHLLHPKPGKRVAYGDLPGLAEGGPAWDLAQWSSRFPLGTNDWAGARGKLTYANNAKTVVIGWSRGADADISLAANAGVEYPKARKSSAEPWVHLLLQQDFSNPPALSPLKALPFHVEARLKHSRLANTNDYSPAIHAAQFTVYFTVANRNLKAAGYGECFWFGIPMYDNRSRVVPAYEAQDFGETRLFIFTPSSDTFASRSTHDGDWVTFDKDLLPLIKQGIAHAREKGFFKGSTNPADFRPLGIFIGWELPGAFDVSLQMRNLGVSAITP